MTRPSRLDLGVAVLVLGTLAATVLGTELVARQDKAAAIPNASTMTTISVPTGQGAARLELPPVPRAISPVLRPVARSRSSR